MKKIDALIALVAGAGVEGCSCNSSDTTGASSSSSSATGGGGGPAGHLTTATPLANDAMYTTPFDAALSDDGSVAYFSAVGPNGPGIFSIPASGGAIAKVADGDPLVTPFSIALATDGKPIYVADIGAAG